MTTKINWLRPLAHITDRYIAKMRSAIMQRLKDHAHNVTLACDYRDEILPVMDAAGNWQFMAPMDIIVSLAWLAAHDDQGRLSREAFLHWLCPSTTQFKVLSVRVLLNDAVYYERENQFAVFATKKAYIDIDHPSITDGAYMCAQLGGIFHMNPRASNDVNSVVTELRGFVGRTRPAGIPQSFSPLLGIEKNEVFKRGFGTELSCAQALCQFMAFQMIDSPYASRSMGLPRYVNGPDATDCLVYPLTAHVMELLLTHRPYKQWYNNASWVSSIAYNAVALQALEVNNGIKVLNADNPSTTVEVRLVGSKELIRERTL